MDAKTLGQQPVNAGEFDYIGSNRAAANGITKRELFAVMAMQGMLANAYYVAGSNTPIFPPHDAAVLSISYADALLAELAEQ